MTAGTQKHVIQTTLTFKKYAHIILEVKNIVFSVDFVLCKAVILKMLRIVYSNTPRKLKGAMGYDPITGHGKGPKGRIDKLRIIVTELIRHERLEGSLRYMDETRGYVELVCS